MMATFWKVVNRGHYILRVVKPARMQEREIRENCLKWFDHIQQRSTNTPDDKWSLLM